MKPAPLVAIALNTYGWRATAFASGVFAITLGLPLTRLMRHKPEQYGCLPDGDTPRQRERQAEERAAQSGRRASMAPAVDFTTREALRTPAFWFISFGHASALLVVSAVMVHLVAHLKESMGYSVTEAATVVALLLVAYWVLAVKPAPPRRGQT